MLFACNMHLSEVLMCVFTERAKEKVKNVVEMYGMQGVQTLMAQMYVLISLYSNVLSFFIVCRTWNIYSYNTQTVASYLIYGIQCIFINMKTWHLGSLSKKITSCVIKIITLYWYKFVAGCWPVSFREIVFEPRLQKSNVSELRT